MKRTSNITILFIHRSHKRTTDSRCHIGILSSSWKKYFVHCFFNKIESTVDMCASFSREVASFHSILLFILIYETEWYSHRWKLTKKSSARHVTFSSWRDLNLQQMSTLTPRRINWGLEVLLKHLGILFKNSSLTSYVELCCQIFPWEWTTSSNES